LAEAMAETDRLDPGWRLADILANRPPLPDAENGALRLLAAFEYRGNEWLPFSLDEYVGTVAPCEDLLPERAKELRAKLAAKEPALIEARKMADMPHGRFTIDWTTNPIVATIPYDPVRSVVNLLHFDVSRRLYDGDADGALVSCRAAVHAGQYIGEEPSLLAFLVRSGCLGASLLRVERILAQGNPTEDALHQMQELLEEEDRRPVFYRTVRGERALNDHCLDLFARGLLPRGMLERWLDTPAFGNFKTNYAWLDAWIKSFQVTRAMNNIPAGRARLLQINNELVAIAQLPAEDQMESLRRLHSSIANEPALARAFAVPPAKVGDANLRTIARIRTAITIIALERYRLKYGRWPDTLAELSPEFLAKPLLDPFAKTPLRMKRMTDGLVVYSVSADGIDDDGDVDANHPGTPGRDVGFRLWDSDKRRQPAKPKAAEKSP
ncbi:MAG: hypothetical protein C5B58_07915, partial [Acidobacteria bacterium]